MLNWLYYNPDDIVNDKYVFDMKEGDQMKALDLINEKLNFSNIVSANIQGSVVKVNNDLDCDCVDTDCTTETYCEG